MPPLRNDGMNEFDTLYHLRNHSNSPLDIEMYIREEEQRLSIAMQESRKRLVEMQDRLKKLQKDVEEAEKE